MALPQDTSVEAEYTDGFNLSETEHGDVSPYTGEHNIFNDILEKRPEADHGLMVRFSCYYKDHRYDVDWTTLPINARPIRFRNASLSTEVATGAQTFCWLGVDFGYQYNDEHGINHKEIQEIK